MTEHERYLDSLERLRTEARAARGLHILSLFEHEADRMQRFSLEAAGLWVDLSRHRVPRAALAAMGELVDASGLVQSRRAMYAGEPINTTEKRAVFHVALRAAPDARLTLGAEGEPVSAAVQETLSRMREFASRVRDGDWRGDGGHRITDVVNVGIGGSQLGPLLACEALGAPLVRGPRIHFLANIDPEAWTRIAAGLDPRSTLAVIASKSWRTLETARNAQAVRDWLLASGIEEAELHRHLVGVTANPEGARAFGLAERGIFPFRDWVGGRYSLWSAIGLPVMLRIGAEGFDAMLEGARSMDEHFLATDWERNIPVRMALTSLWNQDAVGSQTEAVIPYSMALSRLPAYLQQLQMESNGKSVDLEGRPVRINPSPVIWGEPGTDAQHSFFQALHQAPVPQPVDFVLVRPSEFDSQGRALGLAANAIAQAEALLHGQPGAADPHRRYEGNRPSSTILLDALTPFSFGALIALYEHKTAALGWLARVNSFDQWGVELGKAIAIKHEALLTGERDAASAGLDPSIAALLERMRGA